MRLFIKGQYDVPAKKVQTIMELTAQCAQDAIVLVNDLQQTGRVSRVTITDEYDSHWTVKELTRYVEELQQQPHDVVLYFDGSFQAGNVGLGAVVYYRTDERMRIRKNRFTTDIATNNEAEYAAFYEALRLVEELGVTAQTITVRGDSQVVMMQMRGDWPIYERALLYWADKLDALIHKLKLTVHYEHIERAHNIEAHRLAAQAQQGTLVEAHAPHESKRKQRRKHR